MEVDGVRLSADEEISLGIYAGDVQTLDPIQPDITHPHDFVDETTAEIHRWHSDVRSSAMRPSIFARMSTDSVRSARLNLLVEMIQREEIPAMLSDSVSTILHF